MCPICNDRGIIIDDNNITKKCVCTVEKELRILLSELQQYKTDKTFDTSKLKGTVNVINGSEFGFYSLVKSYLFKKYFTDTIHKSSFVIATGISIVEDYLSETHHHHLYTIPYLFINLTQFYTNKAMGEIIHYTVRQRQSQNLTTLLYTGKMKPAQIAEAYSIELQEYLSTIQTANIDKFTKGVEC